MHTFTHAGHTLTWEEHSPGGHTLIFINGYSANRTFWLREVRRLAHLGRCVTLDLPGHFPAQAPPGYARLTQEDLLDLEARAVEAIVGDGTCTLIGHSTGGLVALGVAARLPARVRRVVSIAGVVWGPLTGFLGAYQRAMGRPGGYPRYWLNYTLSKCSWRLVRWGIGLTYVGDREAYARNGAIDEIVRRWHPTYRQSRIRNFYVLLATLRCADVREEARRVACPVLAISGGADPVVPPANARWLAANLPDVTLLEVPGAGHVVHWEAQELVERELLGWLAAHPVTP
ncbi:MAG: alpha/beta hydrolase [Chloroflexales bacterium]|nr:alpha/beta hydrolase [Chloroflexales bacterium]